MMPKHHRPQGTVSDSSHLHFNPGDALENLRADMMGVEALIHAAGEAVIGLGAPSGASQRRTFARIYALVTLAAEQASAALTNGDRAVAALNAQMAARRAQREAGPPAAKA
jgi:hypothetical protein